MQSMKRLTALVMAAVMVLSLAGCGGSGSTAAQARPQTAPQLQRPVQRPSAPAPTAPAAPETVLISLWAMCTMKDSPNNGSYQTVKTTT